jgi:lysophospholipase L1-like esterase
VETRRDRDLVNARITSLFAFLALAAAAFGQGRSVAASSPGLVMAALVDVCNGDSHTYGNLDVANAYPLKLAATPGFEQVRVVNLGQNGWTCANVSAIYAQARKYSPNYTHRPAIYWLHIGSNDVGAGQTAATVYANIEALLTTAKADGFLIGLTVPWDGNFGDGRDAVMTTLQGLIRGDTLHDFLFDGAATFTPVNTGANFLTSSNHLSPTGQAVYAAAVASLIEAGAFLRD